MPSTAVARRPSARCSTRLTPTAAPPCICRTFFYLIRHPEGDVLFDSGAHPALMSDPRGRLGEDADRSDIVIAPGDDVAGRLGTLGVDAGDVGHVVQSHLHYDHCGGLEFLTGATVYVQKEELAFAYWPPVYQRAAFARQDFDAVRNWRQLRGEYDVFNDGRLLIFPTPGHTPGHQSLLARLGRRAYILTGDAVYDQEKMRHRRLPGCLWSPDAVIESWQRIEEMQRRHNATLIVAHDLHWEESVRLAPQEWYERPLRAPRGRERRGRRPALCVARAGHGGAELGHIVEQLAGVFRVRVVEHVRDGPALDDPPVVHDDYLLGDAADERDVVGDEDHRKPVLPLEPAQQLDDGRLDRHVERGCDLVADQQPGRDREGPGYRYPLAFPTG
jgi:N-acyl homoserine lactone hydrolase